MKKALILFMCVSLFLCGCATEEPQEKATNLKLVTSFYPIMLLTKAVVSNIEGITVTNMTKPQTGCLHDYTLLPEDMKNLEDADVFIVNGLGMEKFLDKVIQGFPDLKIIDLSKDITAVDNNPHIWVSPNNAIKMIDNLRAQLSIISPSNSMDFHQNANLFARKLNELNDKIRLESKTFTKRDIVTFHESFAYFASDYNLKVKAVIEREPGQEPTPKELAETIDIVKKTNVKALFAEPQYSSSSAGVIAGETGAIVYYLDPVVTGSNDASPDEYINTMNKNLEVLKEALK